AWNAPDCGWVITIFLSARILPPPTGTSEVLASAAGAAAAPDSQAGGGARQTGSRAGRRGRRGAGLRRLAARYSAVVGVVLAASGQHGGARGAGAGQHGAPARRRDAGRGVAGLGHTQTPQRLMPKVEKNQ